MVSLLTAQLPFFFSPATYLENEGVAGARKRAAEDDDDDDDGESLGSHTTTDSDDEMSDKKKKPTYKPSAAPAPAAANKSKTKDDTAGVARQLAAMTLRRGIDWGFDFTGACPYFWVTYLWGSARFLKIDILVPTPHHEDLEPILSADCLYLDVMMKIPDMFLNVARMFTYYTNPADNVCTITDSDSIFTSSQRAIKDIKEHFNLQDIKPVQRIKLPFQVLPLFQDPYHWDGEQTGFAVRSYPHEKDRNRKITVFHVSMRDAKDPRVKAKPSHADLDVDDDLFNQYN